MHTRRSRRNGRTHRSRALGLLLAASTVVVSGLALVLLQSDGTAASDTIGARAHTAGLHALPSPTVAGGPRTPSPTTLPDDTPDSLSATQPDLLPDVTGVLRGRILDEQGAPVVGARVAVVPDDASAQLAGHPDTSLWVLRGDPGWMDEVPAWDTLTATTTDAEGHFRLKAAFPHPERLPSGTARSEQTDDNAPPVRSILPTLLVSHPGFVPAEQTCTSWVTWSEGEYDAGVCTLRRGGEVHGRVVDEDGSPRMGAPVLLLGNLRIDEWKRPDEGFWFGTGCGMSGLSDVRWERRSTGHLSTTTHTDTDGRFLLTGVAPGISTVLMASSPGRLPAHSESFRLSEHDLHAHDVGTLQLAVGSRMTGVVRDASGAPIAGAEVFLGACRLDADVSVHERAAAARQGLVDDTGEASMKAILAARLHTTTTGPDGRWTLDGLDRARYEVFAEHAGLETDCLSGVAVGREDVDLVLAAHGSWRVAFEDTDGNTLPVSRAQVHRVEGRAERTLRREDPRADPEWHDATSALDPATGLWTLPGVCTCRQTVTLEIGGPGTDEIVTHSVELDGWRAEDASAPRTVTVATAPPAEPPKETGPTRSKLTVQVEDGSGAPVVGARVALHQHVPTNDPPHVVRGYTNRSGASKLGVWLPGVFRVEATLIGSDVPLATTDVLVSPGSEGTAHLVLTGARKLTGRVVLGDEQMSSDISRSMKVAIRTCKPGTGPHGTPGHATSDHEKRETKSDSEGHFSFWVPEGVSGGVQGWAKNACTDEAAFHADSEQALDELVITMGAGSLSGIVRDADTAQPLVRASVLLRAPSSSTLKAVTDEHGAFLFQQLTPGDYTLRAWRSGWIGTTPEDITVRADHAASVNGPFELRLPRAAALSGRVLTPDGDTYLPWRGIGLYRQELDGSWTCHERDNIQGGSFRLQAAEPGTYVLLLASGDKITGGFRDALADSIARWDIVLGPGEQLEVDLPLPASTIPDDV